MCWKLKEYSQCVRSLIKFSRSNSHLRIKSTQAKSSGNHFWPILSVMRFIIVNLNFIESILSSVWNLTSVKNSFLFMFQLNLQLFTRYKWKGVYVWKLKRDSLDGWVSRKGKIKVLKILLNTFKFFVRCISHFNYIPLFQLQAYASPHGHW